MNSAEDEAARDRANFEYTFDLLNKVEVPFLLEPGRTWVESNSSVREVISKIVDYDDLLSTHINETDKGMHLKAQEKFVADRSGQEILCEALYLRSCLKDACPLYAQDTKPPTCREFKIAFRKQ